MSGASLSPEQLEKIKTTFHSFDKDGNNKLSTKELANGLRLASCTITDEEAQHVVNLFDENKDGVLDLAEFIVLVSVIRACEGDVKRLIFRLFDQNGDGFITDVEIRNVYEGIGIPVTDEEIHLMISEVDGDHDGKINYPEFLRLLDKIKGK